MSTEIIIILTNTILVLAYFKLVPYYLRKRASSGTVAIPDDEIDEQLSPVLARVIYQGKVDNKSFVISIFDLVQRGAIKVRRADDGIITLIKAGFINDNFIEEEERVVLASLFYGRNEFVLDKLHENSLGKAFMEFKEVVNQRTDKLLKTSRAGHYFFLSLPVVLVLVSTYFYLGIHGFGIFDIFVYMFFGAMLVIPLGFFLFLFHGLYRLVKKYRKTSTGLALIALASFLVVWILIFTEVIFFSYVYLSFPIFLQVWLIVTHKDNIRFSKSSTEMLGQVKGFRMYLNSVDKYRAVILNKTIPESYEDYERNFSYILALFDDVEIDWVEEVSDLVGRTNFHEVSMPITDFE